MNFFSSDTFLVFHFDTQTNSSQAFIRSHIFPTAIRFSHFSKSLLKLNQFADITKHTHAHKVAKYYPFHHICYAYLFTCGIEWVLLSNVQSIDIRINLCSRLCRCDIRLSDLPFIFFEKSIFPSMWSAIPNGVLSCPFNFVTSTRNIYKKYSWSTFHFQDNCPIYILQLLKYNSISFGQWKWHKIAAKM